MLVDLDEIRIFIGKQPEAQRGCILDTNVLFAVFHPLDVHNEWAESTLNELRKLSIKAYTNINVRSEFIELCRRVMIPEGLVDAYDELGDCLPERARMAIRSLKTRMDNAIKEERTFKMSDSEIKRFRELFNLYEPTAEEDGWEYFCKGYLHPYIEKAWPFIVGQIHLEFLGTRAIERKEYFHSSPSWTGMVNIVGRFGIGAADAMIVNHFLSSKQPFIVTADSDVRGAVAKLAGEGKYVLGV